MPSLTVTAPTRGALREARLRPRALLGLALSTATLVAAAAGAALAVTRFAALDPAWPGRVALFTAAGGGLVLLLAAWRLAAATFGAANHVTLVRGALTMSLLALLGGAVGPAVAWVAIVAAVVALVLDGVDGALARRRGEATAFGARFDMETDALLIVALAALAWQLGKAGAWILLAGALRYLFVLAGRAWPALAAPLPPSRRRQTVCVVQITALIVCLAPFVPSPVSAALGLASVVVLIASFATDVAWLVRRSRS